MAMLIVTAPMAFAVPAAPGVFIVKQLDGTVVNTIARGDEHQSWMETEQGHTIAKGVDGNWYYAADPTSGVPANGPLANMVVSRVNVALQLTNVRAEKPPLANLPKHIKPPKLFSRLMAPMFGAPSLASSPSLASTPPVGQHTGKMLILMVDFTDRAGTYTATDFSGFSNSVAAYYNTVSNGNVTLTSATETHGTANDGVIGWLRLNHVHPNCGSAQNTACTQPLIQEAITAAAPFVNFAAYDTNADGRITGDELAVIVFAAGYEKSIGDAAALTPNVWGHAWWERNFTIPGSTKVVDGYTLMGEIHGPTAKPPTPSHQATLGIVVHELGHLMFQWPDLYDYDHSSEGIGNWCLMSGGSWGKTTADLYGGQTPVMPSAWIRKKSGWVNTQPANGAVSVIAAGAATATASNTVIQAVTSGATTEYFLIENRQDIGYDRGLKGLMPSFSGGLAIWHIDEAVSPGPNGGVNENDTHRMVNLEASDGWTGVPLAPVGSRGAGTNLWYSGNGVNFNSTSTPNSNLYKEWWQLFASPSGVSVSAISASATVMTANTASSAVGFPSINAFSVSPTTRALGQPFTINYTVSDSGGLNRVVLRRTSGDGSASDPGWQDISTNPASGVGQVSGSFSDTPPNVGAYWYGMAVFDNQGNSTNERQAAKASAQVTVTPAPCSYSLNPPSLSPGAVAASGNINVTAASGCAWTAISNASWITVTSGTSGSGNGTVYYSVAANTGSSSRTGTLTIAGQTFTVTQASATSASGNWQSNIASTTNVTDIMSFTLTQSGNTITGRGTDRISSVYCGPLDSSLAVTGSVSGQQVTLNITTTSDRQICRGTGVWNGYSLQSATKGYSQTITANVSGNVMTFNACAFVDISSNVCLAYYTSFSRVSTLCAYALSPSSQSVSAGGVTGNVNVTGGAGCAWSAASNDSWISVTTGSSGSGNGTVVYSVAVNTGASSRTGTLTIAGQTFTVTQAGASSSTPCASTIDTDGDGISDCVETTEGTNPGVKDNDVFSNNRLFVMQQYRDFLSREADSGGLSGWLGAVDAGSISKAQLIESFFSSAEFQGTAAPVVRLYFAYFLRIPDYAGLQYWIGQYQAGMTLAAISESFAASAEFTNRYGTLDNGQFVDLVYFNVLGRPADSGGRAYWLAQLDSGTLTKGQVMLGFSESAEYQSNSYNRTYVTMMYVGMLRRSPEQGGFDAWVSSMGSGLSGQKLIDGFIGSQEYRGRFM